MILRVHIEINGVDAACTGDIRACRGYRFRLIYSHGRPGYILSGLCPEAKLHRGIEFYYIPGVALDAGIVGYRNQVTIWDGIGAGVSAVIISWSFSRFADNFYRSVINRLLVIDNLTICIFFLIVKACLQCQGMAVIIHSILRIYCDGIACNVTIKSNTLNLDRFCTPNRKTSGHVCNIVVARHIFAGRIYDLRIFRLIDRTSDSRYRIVELHRLYLIAISKRGVGIAVIGQRGAIVVLRVTARGDGQGDAMLKPRGILYVRSSSHDLRGPSNEVKLSRVVRLFGRGLTVVARSRICFNIFIGFQNGAVCIFPSDRKSLCAFTCSFVTLSFIRDLDLHAPAVFEGENQRLVGAEGRETLEQPVGGLLCFIPDCLHFHKRGIGERDLGHIRGGDLRHAELFQQGGEGNLTLARDGVCILAPVEVHGIARDHIYGEAVRLKLDGVLVEGIADRLHLFAEVEKLELFYTI